MADAARDKNTGPDFNALLAENDLLWTCASCGAEEALQEAAGQLERIREALTLYVKEGTWDAPYRIFAERIAAIVSEGDET